MVLELIFLDQLLGVLQLAQIALLSLEVQRQALVDSLDAGVHLGLGALAFILVRKRRRVDVALLNKLVLLVPNKIEPVDVVCKQGRSHVEHVARRMLRDIRVGGGHNRDQHVQKHDLHEERRKQKANPQQSREIIVRKGADVEVSQAHEVLVDHSVDQFIPESLDIQVLAICDGRLVSREARICVDLVVVDHRDANTKRANDHKEDQDELSQVLDGFNNEHYVNRRVFEDSHPHEDVQAQVDGRNGGHGRQNFQGSVLSRMHDDNHNVEKHHGEVVQVVELADVLHGADQHELEQFNQQEVQSENHNHTAESDVGPLPLEEAWVVVVEAFIQTEHVVEHNAHAVDEEWVEEGVLDLIRHVELVHQYDHQPVVVDLLGALVQSLEALRNRPLEPLGFQHRNVVADLLCVSRFDVALKLLLHSLAEDHGTAVREDEGFVTVRRLESSERFGLLGLNQ